MYMISEPHFEKLCRWHCNFFGISHNPKIVVWLYPPPPVLLIIANRIVRVPWNQFYICWARHELFSDQSCWDMYIHASTYNYRTRSMGKLVYTSMKKWSFFVFHEMGLFSVFCKLQCWYSSETIRVTTLPQNLFLFINNCR